MWLSLNRISTTRHQPSLAPHGVMITKLHIFALWKHTCNNSTSINLWTRFTTPPPPSSSNNEEHKLTSDTITVVSSKQAGITTRLTADITQSAIYPLWQVYLSLHQATRQNIPLSRFNDSSQLLFIPFVNIISSEILILSKTVWFFDKLFHNL